MATEITNITYKKLQAENKGNCRILDDIYCNICKMEMTHKLIGHDYEKMYTIVSCDNHPLIVWEDVFNKKDIPDDIQDWTNCDRRFKY